LPNESNGSFVVNNEIAVKDSLEMFDNYQTGAAGTAETASDLRVGTLARVARGLFGDVAELLAHRPDGEGAVLGVLAYC